MGRCAMRIQVFVSGWIKPDQEDDNGGHQYPQQEHGKFCIANPVFHRLFVYEWCAIVQLCKISLFGGIYRVRLYTFEQGLDCFRTGYCPDRTGLQEQKEKD